MSIIEQAAADKRHIARADFAPCARAFIDRRNPNSAGKLNYAFIGPGVAQSDAQFVNLTEAHGFNVGGVSLPAGRINNLHLHFTAEVFIPVAGDWEFIWGNAGESSARVGRFDVFSIPTWIFRGFINRGRDDDFMFAVLGGDDTGGIAWNPTVLADAARAGLRLTAAGRVVDLHAGESADGEAWMPAISDAAMNALPTFTPVAMARFIARWEDLRWRDDGLPGGAGGVQLAPVIGHGMTMARHHYPPITHPHGFSLEWLRIRPGAATGAWRSRRPQVAIVFAGAVEARLNAPDSPVTVELAARSIFSAPANAWRALHNPGDADAIVLLINGGDARFIPEWDAAAHARAADAGQVIDADARLAPVAVVNPSAATAA